MLIKFKFECKLRINLILLKWVANITLSLFLRLYIPPFSKLMFASHLHVLEYCIPILAEKKLKWLKFDKMVIQCKNNTLKMRLKLNYSI